MLCQMVNQVLIGGTHICFDVVQIVVNVGKPRVHCLKLFLDAVKLFLHTIN